MNKQFHSSAGRRRLLKQTAAIAALSPLSSSMRVRAAADIEVGAAIPLTGNFAASGIQYYNSLRLAQDDINGAGGIQGRKLNIAFEDTGASNSTAVNALLKLVKQSRPPFIFLSSLSTQTLAMEPEIARSKVTTVYGGGAAAIAERKNPWMFRIRPADPLQGVAIAEGVKTLLNKRRPGILYAQDDYGLGAANAVDAALGKLGVKVIAREAFNPRDNDFSAQLLSLKAQGVDCIVSFNYNRDGALILKQRRSLGIDLPLLAGSGMVAPSTIDLVDVSDLVGVYGTADALLGESVSPASADFVKRYQQAYKFRPDGFGGAYYDVAMILADGLRKVGPDAEKLRGHLSSLKDFKGVVRSYTNDPATNDLAHDVVLATFKPGTKELMAAVNAPKR